MIDKTYYKCTNPFCVDNKYLVWYPNGIPDSPSCTNCKEEYKQKIEDK